MVFSDTPSFAATSFNVMNILSIIVQCCPHLAKKTSIYDQAEELSIAKLWLRIIGAGCNSSYFYKRYPPSFGRVALRMCKEDFTVINRWYRIRIVVLERKTVYYKIVFLSVVSSTEKCWSVRSISV